MNRTRLVSLILLMLTILPAASQPTDLTGIWESSQSTWEFVPPNLVLVCKDKQIFVGVYKLAESEQSLTVGWIKNVSSGAAEPPERYSYALRDQSLTLETGEEAFSLTSQQTTDKSLPSGLWLKALENGRRFEYTGWLTGQSGVLVSLTGNSVSGTLVVDSALLYRIEKNEKMLVWRPDTKPNEDSFSLYRVDENSLDIVPRSSYGRGIDLGELKPSLLLEYPVTISEEHEILWPADASKALDSSQGLGTLSQVQQTAFYLLGFYWLIHAFPLLILPLAELSPYRKAQKQIVALSIGAGVCSMAFGMALLSSANSGGDGGTAVGRALLTVITPAVAIVEMTLLFIPAFLFGFLCLLVVHPFRNRDRGGLEAAALICTVATLAIIANIGIHHPTLQALMSIGETKWLIVLACFCILLTCMIHWRHSKLLCLLLPITTFIFSLPFYLLAAALAGPEVPWSVLAGLAVALLYVLSAGVRAPYSTEATEIDPQKPCKYIFFEVTDQGRLVVTDQQELNYSVVILASMCGIPAVFALFEGAGGLALKLFLGAAGLFILAAVHPKIEIDLDKKVLSQKWFLFGRELTIMKKEWSLDQVDRLLVERKFAFFTVKFEPFQGQAFTVARGQNGKNSRALEEARGLAQLLNLRFELSGLGCWQDAE